MAHYILPYSGVDLQSRQGLKVLVDFAERNQLMDESFDVVLEIMISKEEEAAADALWALWETQRSAMPNCFD